MLVVVNLMTFQSDRVQIECGENDSPSIVHMQPINGAKTLKCKLSYLLTLIQYSTYLLHPEYLLDIEEG